MGSINEKILCRKCKNGYSPELSCIAIWKCTECDAVNPNLKSAYVYGSLLYFFGGGWAIMAGENMKDLAERYPHIEPYIDIPVILYPYYGAWCFIVGIWACLAKRPWSSHWLGAALVITPILSIPLDFYWSCVMVESFALFFFMEYIPIVVFLILLRIQVSGALR